MRRLLVLLPVLLGCPEPTAELALSASTAYLSQDGGVTRLLARAFDARGAPGVGGVSFAASSGVLSEGTVELVEGVAKTDLRCLFDAGCPGPITLTASWKGLTATRKLGPPPPPPSGTETGPIEPPGDAGLVEPDAGWVGPPVDGGRVEFDAGTSLAEVTGRPSLWWRADGGVYEVRSGDDEVPSYDCGEWDGGAHPGYTLPDGGPFAVGCAGEAIDYLVWESGSTLNICGTVELSEPVAEPVYPRALFAGRFALTGPTQFLGWRLQCLRNPSRITYRFSLQPIALFVLGMGVRTSGFGRSLFGYFDGTTASPVTALDAGVPIVVGQTHSGTIDFGVGRGKREGDP